MVEELKITDIQWRKAVCSMFGGAYLVERKLSDNCRQIDVLTHIREGDLYIPLSELRTLPGYEDCLKKKDEK